MKKLFLFNSVAVFLTSSCVFLLLRYREQYMVWWEAYEHGEITLYEESFFKGIVQQKSAGVESGISRKVFLSHWTADILFFNLKRTFSLNRKKLVSAA